MNALYPVYTTLPGKTRLSDAVALANTVGVGIWLTPRGKHLLTVCMGTACHVKGAPRFMDEVLGLLKINPGETTADGEFTVETVNCLGACALSPVVVLDGQYHKHMTTGKLRALIQKIRTKPQPQKETVKP